MITAILPVLSLSYLWIDVATQLLSISARFLLAVGTARQQLTSLGSMFSYTEEIYEYSVYALDKSGMSSSGEFFIIAIARPNKDHFGFTVSPIISETEYYKELTTESIQ